MVTTRQAPAGFLKGITPSVWIPVLIGNIIPLIGVLFFGWSIEQIVILYWVENLIIGFWNIPRILFAGNGSKLKNLPLSFFFIIHYGIFCLVHGVFIMGLVGFSASRDLGSSMTDTSLFSGVAAVMSPGLIIAIIMMFFNIGWNLVHHYIINGEHQTWTTAKAMKYPYAHIIVVHIAIFAGAFGAILLGAPLALLIALIVGKALIELKTTQMRLYK